MQSDDSDAALVVGSSDEEDFTTLTSGDGRKQYRPPDQTRQEPRFGAKKNKGGSDPIKCLKQQLGNDDQEDEQLQDGNQSVDKRSR